MLNVKRAEPKFTQNSQPSIYVIHFLQQLPKRIFGFPPGYILICVQSFSFFCSFFFYKILLKSVVKCKNVKTVKKELNLLHNFAASFFLHLILVVARVESHQKVTLQLLFVQNAASQVMVFRLETFGFPKNSVNLEVDHISYLRLSTFNWHQFEHLFGLGVCVVHFHSMLNCLLNIVCLRILLKPSTQTRHLFSCNDFLHRLISHRQLENWQTYQHWQ